MMTSEPDPALIEPVAPDSKSSGFFFFDEVLGEWIAGTRDKPKPPPEPTWQELQKDKLDRILSSRRLVGGNDGSVSSDNSKQTKKENTKPKELETKKLEEKAERQKDVEEKEDDGNDDEEEEKAKRRARRRGRMEGPTDARAQRSRSLNSNRRIGREVGSGSPPRRRASPSPDAQVRRGSNKSRDATVLKERLRRSSDKLEDCSTCTGSLKGAGDGSVGSGGSKSSTPVASRRMRNPRRSISAEDDGALKVRASTREASDILPPRANSKSKRGLRKSISLDLRTTGNVDTAVSQEIESPDASKKKRHSGTSSSSRNNTDEKKELNMSRRGSVSKQKLQSSLEKSDEKKELNISRRGSVSKQKLQSSPLSEKSGDEKRELNVSRRGSVSKPKLQSSQVEKSDEKKELNVSRRGSTSKSKNHQSPLVEKSCRSRRSSDISPTAIEAASAKSNSRRARRSSELIASSVAAAVAETREMALQKERSSNSLLKLNKSPAVTPSSTPQPTARIPRKPRSANSLQALLAEKRVGTGKKPRRNTTALVRLRDDDLDGSNSSISIDESCTMPQSRPKKSTRQKQEA